VKKKRSAATEPLMLGGRTPVIAERVRNETKAPVYIHAADKAAASRARVLPWYGLLSNAWRPYMRQMLAHATINGVFWQPAIEKVETVADNAVLDIPERPVVLHVPSHTPGETALFLPESRILFSGDTLVTRHLLNGRYGPPQVISPVLTDDTPLAYRSLDRLRELGEATMLPGHGRAWMGNMASAVEAARATAPAIASVTAHDRLVDAG
jgi:glyoxylase-like metal-dependent hydrolase (beta-lactamase superfamily II)